MIDWFDDQSLHMSRDSSVGRAGDCSGLNSDISRSAVQIRLAGLPFLFEKNKHCKNGIVKQVGSSS